MSRRGFTKFLAGGILVLATWLTASAQTSPYLVTNDGNRDGNTATFYSLGANGVPTQVAVVPTGGLGIRHTFYASPGVAVMGDGGDCIYVANAASFDISSIVASSLKLAGTFKVPPHRDYGEVSLAISGRALYAGFSQSYTMATFAMGAGCSLQYLGDVVVHGQPVGMKVRGDLLVMAYGDGDIESFDVSGTLPVSNGDLQQSTGNHLYGGMPGGVEITKDGHWALFGDGTNPGGIVEVSDISSGKLAATVPYRFGRGNDSNNVVLSPDEKLLYVSQNLSGNVVALSFDSTTGVIGKGCSSTLRGNRSGITAGIAAAPANNGSDFVYLAEAPNRIGVLSRTGEGAGCTLSEVPGSPITDPQSTVLTSIAIYSGQ
ncbi:MAG: hypothetical protein H0X25_19180 [Acidobacteriales bacterium]|nr:hypothetical protein [Terriglobales bacterium]